MKIALHGGLMLVGAICASLAPVSAQVIELRATLSPTQEVPATSSPARGSAIMLYDLASNTFDLIVSIESMANLATGSHLHEAPAGTNGSVVTNLGGDAVYTRTGSNLRATLRGITYGGDRIKLLQSGAYYNIHSAQFPGGEIRGQLMAQPKRLVANMDVAQEQAAFPNVNFSALNDFGAAVMYYNPATHSVRLRMSLFNFNNPFSNSHFHVGAPGVSGPVSVNLGNNANAGGYTSANGHISGSFDIPMGNADPIALLSGNLYLNFHSTAFAGGELRGQVRASDEIPGTRLANLSVRGFAGTGDQVLIQGLTVNGPDPIRVLIAAKGPSLATFGVSGVLANPRVQLFDAKGLQIAINEDVGAIAAGSELAAIPGVPTNPVEAALVLVLPPGNYTAIVSSTSGTGIALLEISDLRNLGGTVVPASVMPGEVVVAAPVRALPGAAKAALELCVGVPLVATVAIR